MKLEKTARNFIWENEYRGHTSRVHDHTSRVHAVVDWKRVCRPKMFGGLGMTTIKRFVHALRLR